MPVEAPHVQVDLVADSAVAVPGREVHVGVRFALEHDWHIYWRNPGDSGEAPSIEWTLPPGFVAGEIQWPVPSRITGGTLTNFGYAGTPLLPVSVQVPNNLSGASTGSMQARVKWLVCDPEECIPGSANLSLDLPVGNVEQPSVDAPAFAAAARQLPSAPPLAWTQAASASSDALTLSVHGDGAQATQAAFFFPSSGEILEASGAQVLTTDANGFRLTLPRWRQSTAVPVALDGVLSVGDSAYKMSVPVSTPGFSPEPLLLAFVGGLLLNLMPCVLPVLTLKALGLFGLAGERRRRARSLGLLYGLGVLASFWVLAGTLLLLRAGGQQLGWGFQLQSPMFVAMLAALFFWMALTLLGATSIGASFMGVGNRLTKGESYRSAFFTGVLATVVATPCTAPFMGTALGYALGQPAPIAMAVFTSLALGLALPYVAISFVPKLASRLPRPGAWMETLKQFLAFPLLATVVWLIWVMSLQGGPAAVVATLSILLLIGFAAWATGRSSRPWSRAAAVVALAAALWVGRSIQTTSSGAANAIAWETYSTSRLAELLEQERPVFVDFTAAWCVTCQMNEQLALDTQAVRAKMHEVGVVPVRADWTRPDPDITRALQEFGRDGVPLYLLYSGKRHDPPRVLPQLLTREIVISELEQLKTRRRT